MSLNIKRIQLTENGVTQDVDILTSAECVTFEDGDTLQAKLDNGDLASSDVLGDVDSLNGNVVDSLNELNDSAKETSELVSELANRGGVTSALRKEVASGEWKSVSTLPFYSTSTVILNDEIHILGGSSSTSYKTSHYKYNGESWESASTLPYEFWGGRAVVYNGEIHILGSNNSSYYTAHYKYNGNVWESVSTLPYDFCYSSTVVFDNEIHIMGSMRPNYYTRHYKWNGSSWSSVSTLPYNFYRGSAIIYDNQIRILGGQEDSTTRKRHYKRDGSTWVSVGTLPYEFYRGSALVSNNEVHILGGYYSGYYTAHYKYNGSSWSSVSTLPYNFYDGNAIVLNEIINILGGNSTTNHYSLKPAGTYLNGYSKSNTDIYLPISTTPITSNLTATEDGYTVTEDGYVEILLNE